MELRIAVVPGDGIGPDIVREAVSVLKKVCEVFNHTLVTETVLAGGAAIDEYGIPLPESTLDACKRADAVLLGAVGGPKWDNVESSKDPRRPCSDSEAHSDSSATSARHFSISS